MAFETIAVDVDDHIMTIRLDRPDALNALSGQVMEELAEALDTAGREARVRCVIVTGSEKAFAAGADIREMADKSFAEMFAGGPFEVGTAAFARCRKPVIAAVSGYALGGGCELMMLCDFAIAADTAKFGMPEVNLGVMPGIGGTQRLTRLVGRAKAMEMQLTGRFMTAEEAERAGLVSRVVPAKKLMEEARAAAEKITEKSMLAVMAIKEAVHAADEMPLASGVLFEQRLFDGLFATEDQAEGMSAFLEKREPQFRDR
jgi:enoyl-CoA hydratase